MPVLGLRVNLKPPFLMIICPRGVLACGYFSVEVAEKFGVTAAVVRGVSSFDEMLEAKVVSVTSKARELGVAEGCSGRDAVLRFS
ncbi:MAG: DUF1805 domain-containing protein [Candidatus Freyarchaeota archaeon]|nr:DUF1805 domain-containing protein [Candidatus Jordarchaeia archaeon]